MTSVIERNTATRNYDARTEAIVIALDKRNHISVTVSTTQVNGAAGVYIDGFRHQGLIANDPSTLFGIRIRQPVGNGRLHKLRIGNVLSPVDKSQFHGFNLTVNRFGIVSLFIKSKPLYNIECHEDD